MGKKILKNSDSTLPISVYFKEEIALPNNSILKVSLEDISKNDASPIVIASSSLSHLTAPPYKINLEYDSSKIKDKHHYSIRATIQSNDKLLFTSTHETNPFKEQKSNSIYVLVQDIKHANANVDLINTNWKLTKINATKIKNPSVNGFPRILFESEKSSLKGFTGCNDFFGIYELNSDTISFGTIGSTEIMCDKDDDMEVEMEFLRLLSSDVQWRIKGEILELISYKLGTSAYFKREVDDKRVQYLCNHNEQIEVLYDNTDAIVYYHNQTIPMTLNIKSKTNSYVSRDEQNNYRWHVQNEEGVLGFIQSEHTNQERTLLHCYKK